MGNLDRLIAILTSKSLKDFPRLYRGAMAAAHKIANSGLPAALYIRREISGIYEMEQMLSISLRVAQDQMRYWKHCICKSKIIPPPGLESQSFRFLHFFIMPLMEAPAKAAPTTILEK